MPVWLPFAIAAGINVAGGAAGMAQANRIRAPRSLTSQIERVSNPEFYTPMLQRIYSSAQGDATIQRGMARSGMSGSYAEQEALEANQQRAGEMVRQGAQAMEGQRLSLLERLTAQKAQFDMARAQGRMSALNQMTAGLGGLALSGGQAMQQNAQFNQMAGMQAQNNTAFQTMWQDWLKSQGGGGTTNSFVPSGPQGYGPMGFGPYGR